MKKFIALALVTLGVTVSARAQWIVYDPANTVQSVINTAQEIAKFVEMINNQVQQIETLTEQLDEFRHYKELFGDPNAVALTTVQPLVNDLRKTELGQTLTALEGAVDAGEAMLYDANGLFTSIGTTFDTPNGATVTRRETSYLPVAAVQKATVDGEHIQPGVATTHNGGKQTLAACLPLRLKPRSKSRGLNSMSSWRSRATMRITGSAVTSTGAAEGLIMTGAGATRN